MTPLFANRWSIALPSIWLLGTGALIALAVILLVWAVLRVVQPRAAAEARAAELLALTGVGARADHRPAALSGGEQQRVAFCRALANRPRLLLADEPTGNLDPETSDRVFATLMDLVRGTGLAALIATHNLALAGRMDRVLRLDAGRLA